jgi:short-subunit dehydrogenase
VGGGQGIGWGAIRMDVLVANAGVGHGASLTETTEEQLREQMEVKWSSLPGMRRC